MRFQFNHPGSNGFFSSNQLKKYITGQGYILFNVDVRQSFNLLITVIYSLEKYKGDVIPDTICAQDVRCSI